MEWPEIYRALVADRTRLEQIVDDVLTASETGANILVLTTWVEHLNAITEQLRTAGKTVTVLSGGMTARERRQIADQLTNHTPDSDPLLIVGTSSFIGEGIDFPALDTLFPGSANHLQEPPRAIRRSRDPSLPPRRPPQPCTTTTTSSPPSSPHR